MPVKNEKILLLSCPPEYRDQLANEGYDVSTGFVFEYNQDVYKNFPGEYNQCIGTGVDYATPGPVYEYKTLVYNPCRPLFKFSRIASPNSNEPLPNYTQAINEAGTICVVFRNRNLRWSPSHIAARPKVISRSHQETPIDYIYREFWPDLPNGTSRDKISSFSSNAVAETLRSVLEPFLDQGKYPWAAMEGLKQNDHWYPILTNPLGDPHALWVRQDKGGILFLPEFEDNLAVLKALLGLPLSNLLKIEPEPITPESTLTDQRSDNSRAESSLIHSTKTTL